MASTKTSALVDIGANIALTDLLYVAKDTGGGSYAERKAAFSRVNVALTSQVSGILPFGNLGTGGGGMVKFLREDNTWQPIPGGGDALTTSPLSQFAATTSAQLAGVISDETGTGALVFASSPTLVTPALGTPSGIVLTNGTGLPISTGVSGLGASVATFLATPSSANLASAMTDETGSGALVFATSPTLVTPALGTPSSGVLSNATGLPISTGVSGLAAGIATFLGTPSSANLATAVTDETGTGALVFGTSPTFTTDITLPNTGLHILDTNSTHDLIIVPGSNLTADRTLTIITGDADRTLTLTADATIGGTSSGTNTGDVTLAGVPDYITIAGQVITRNKLDPADDLNTFASSVLLGLITDETGTGSLVFATSPALVTPDLGTPSAGVLTNATGLPISSGVSGLAAGIATFLGTPTSANLLAAVTNETGTGALVFGTSPVFTTDITLPNTGLHILDTNASHDLIIAPGSDLTADRTLTIVTGDADRTLTLTGAASISGTNSGDVTLAGTPDYITIAGQVITRNKLDPVDDLNTFASSVLAGLVTDETGSGALVFATSPTLVTPALGTPSSATLTNATGLPLTTGVTGILPHGNLGTGGGGMVKFLREDSTYQTIPGGGDALTTSPLSQFAATTSAQLAGVMSDETGSGLLVFGTSPTITTPTISGAITFPDGVRQTFNPDATVPGLNVGSQAGDPSTLVNGDIWYDSTGNLLRARINGATVSLGAGGGSNPFDDGTAIIKGSADPTKLLRIEVDGFTTATTRVITPPNADITLAGINIAQTFAATQTITPAADTSALIVSGYSVTGAGTAAMIDLAGTWNTSGIANGIKLNITRTAVASSATLIDLQEDSISRFKVEQDGFGTFVRQEADTLSGGISLNKRGTTGDATATVPNGGTITGINFRGWDGSAYGNAGIIRTFALEAWTGSAHGTKMIFAVPAIGGTTTPTFLELSANSVSILNGAFLAIGSPAANGNAIQVTGYSLTGSNASSMIDLAGTWNTSGNPTAIKLNITNTASGATSLLMDLQASTVSQFKVSKAGAVTALGGITAGNALFSVTDTTGVLQLANGTDPAANPTNATTQWAVGGEWQYRSSAASEGAGQTNRVHNRAAEVIGAGTNYNLTTALARIDFGTTDPEITVPTAGTYLIFIGIYVVGDISGISDFFSFAIRNSTDSTTLPAPLPSFSQVVANENRTISDVALVTVTASKTFQIWGKNITSARGYIASTATLIKYVRLY